MLEVFGMSRSGRRRVGVGRALVLGLVAVAAGATAVVMSNGGRSAAAPVTTTFTYGGGPVAIPDGGDLTGNNPGATVGASRQRHGPERSGHRRQPAHRRVSVHRDAPAPPGSASTTPSSTTSRCG